MKNNVLGLSASAFFYNFVVRIKSKKNIKHNNSKGNEKMPFDFSLLDSSCREDSDNGTNCGR